MPPKKSDKSDKPKNVVFTECVRIWLKEIHEGWTFTAMHGKHMHAIITKIKHSIKTSPKNLEVTDELVINSFRMMCQRLPEWFKDKDLQIINSKYNEVIHQIQTGPKKSLNSMNSSTVFGKYGGMV